MANGAYVGLRHFSVFSTKPRFGVTFLLTSMQGLVFDVISHKCYYKAAVNIADILKIQTFLAKTFNMSHH